MKLKKEMKTHKLISPAKINLNLKVINFDKELKKHKLSSKVAIIKLHDVIEINQSNDLKVYELNYLFKNIYGGEGGHYRKDSDPFNYNRTKMGMFELKNYIRRNSVI